MTPPYRSEIRLRLDDPAAQRDVIALGYRREGIARGAGPDREDLVVWARLADDPEGPSPRALPDLPGGELTDGVIRVRPVRSEDLDGWYELRSLPEVVATSVPPVAPPRAEVERLFAYAESRWLAGEAAAMSIVDARSGSFAGQIALYYFQPHHREGMLGYGVLPAFRGRGYARRAVELVTKWAFTEARLQRVVAGTAVGNIASQKALQAAGFEVEARQLGMLPAPDGGRIDSVLYVRRRP
ncbi:GNAT family N-acetyltransferase [Actinoplanes sp. M2I2]|uniref:GNAT family N-acetyltransferase n=1 Tax=Actinoplanes sp. M2I2 TaxID=1734444 RepID=UPI002021D1D2|nr:GNAT family N-acetyltransferase [Actinoplanes sp. M2I2]